MGTISRTATADARTSFLGSLRVLALGTLFTPGRTLMLLEFWMARTNQRRSLAEMPDHMLKDIGITRAEAMREAGKSFWRD